MARVVLAYPYGDHKPDSTIDLPDDEADRLVRDGFARLPEPQDQDQDQLESEEAG